MKEGEDEEELASDQPDLIQGVAIVPKNRLQIEIEGIYWKDTPEDSEVRSRAYPALLLRYGLLDWLELRVQGMYQDTVVRKADEKRQVNGAGPLSAGFRARLWKAKGMLPTAAFETTVRMPLGRNEVTPVHAEPEFLLIFKNEITDAVSLSYQVGYGWENGDAQKIYGLNVMTEFSETVKFYVEALGLAPQDDDSEYFAGIGVLFLLRKNIQLGVAGGRRLNDAAPDLYLSTGLTVRLPK